MAPVGRRGGWYLQGRRVRGRIVKSDADTDCRTRIPQAIETDDIQGIDSGGQRNIAAPETGIVGRDNDLIIDDYFVPGILFAS